MLDKVKIVVALLIILAGVIAYYQLPNILGIDVSILIKVPMVLVSIIVGLLVALSSEYGKAALEFAKGSRTELRKMVWPTAQETRQTTVIIMIMVVLVAVFLWAIDLAVFKVIYDWLLGLKS